MGFGDTISRFRGHHTDLQHSDTRLHSTADYDRRPCRSRASNADSSGQITLAIRGKMPSRASHKFVGLSLIAAKFTISRFFSSFLDPRAVLAVSR